MKNKILFSCLGTLVIATLITVWVRGVDAINQSETDSALTLKVSSDKQTYVLGEAVKLNFEVLNETDKAIALPYSPDVSTGYLNVWIASSNQEFKQYSNTSWGRKEYSGPTLQPEQSFKSQATILWNNKPETSHLNPDAAKRAAEGRIMADYAFPTAGVYLIKAVLWFPEIKLKVESKPIQIVVNEPVGDELEVWNKIKDNGKIAYFIQKGDFPTAKDEERGKLLKEVEQIVQIYPNSFLVSQINQSLEKFRVNEERRKKFMEKLKRPQ